MTSPLLFISDPHSSLITDFYQLTMGACYHHFDSQAIATFEYFLRPQSARSYYVFAGGELLLDYLEQLSFSEEQIHYLKSLQPFKRVSPEFFDFLAHFRFQGEVRMCGEGQIVFPSEPLVQIRGTLIEAQFVETYLLSLLNFQTMIATKAARILAAAQGRPVFEFGTRRAHGPQAGVLAARASYLAGFAGTSNVLAGYHWDIPVTGTAAHSFILSHASEEEAFRHYYELFQEETTLLIDTFDTVKGAKKAAQVGELLKGVRIDSGDLAGLSQEVRRILDQKGHSAAKIIASNDLNEERIEALLEQKACIDAFGVGTELVTSRDQPALSGVYKLVEIEEGGKKQGKMKLSASKISYPGRKQIFRQFHEKKAVQDLLALAEESLEGEPLLETVMIQGKRVRPPQSLLQVRDNHQRFKKQFSPAFFSHHSSSLYPIQASEALSTLQKSLQDSLQKNV